jgi:hypothetical protein
MAVTKVFCKQFLNGFIVAVMFPIGIFLAHGKQLPVNVFNYILADQKYILLDFDVTLLGTEPFAFCRGLSRGGVVDTEVL